MIKKINFLVLTKSAKHHNYCVAGFDVDTKKMVRLCSTNKNIAGALAYDSLICSDNSIIQIGDVVEVEILGRDSSEIQVENLIINEDAKFRKIKKYTISQIADFAQNDDDIFGDTSYKTTAIYAKNCRKSLLFVKVNSLTLIAENNKTKGSFYYNGKYHKWFRVTEQEYFDIVNQVIYNQALVCFSLPDDDWARNNDSYFKYIAKIIPIS